MSFENELKQVFDIDIWLLKPQFQQKKEATEVLKTDNSSSATNSKKAKETNTCELIYCNNLTSDRTINFVIDKPFNLNFLKNIIEKLFYKSKVSVYYANSINTNLTAAANDLVIYQNDFISLEYNLLSIESKKYILKKLYHYADFAAQ